MSAYGKSRRGNGQPSAVRFRFVRENEAGSNRKILVNGNQPDNFRSISGFQKPTLYTLV